MRFFERLVNGFEDRADKIAVQGMAREIFSLFGAMFAAIEMEGADALV